MLWKYLQMLFRRSSPAPPKEGSGEVKALWCVVANVVGEHEYGESKELVNGTKHFAPGTKVFCFPPLWGDGYMKVKVVGRHRGSKRFVTMIILSKWLTNWRVKLVYSPYVIAQLKEHWSDSEELKELAKAIVKSRLPVKSDKT